MNLKKLAIFILIFFAPFSAINAKEKIEILARVTYYWGCKTTSTGKRPVCGKTIAVDPKIIPYGSKVIIPKMQKVFVAHDTGSAVKARTASKKLGKPNVIVVDVFCESKQKAMQRISKYPMFMKIQIESE